jgi:uncharacterized glyoxalase superfamily protein PhnB
VADVTRSMRWYESVLGYTPHPFFEEEPYVFCVLEGERTRIMLQRRPEFRRDPSERAIDVYVTLTGNTLREVYEDLRQRTNVVRELQHMPYGDCEFEIADPDGHVVCISELLDDPSGIPDVRED